MQYFILGVILVFILHKLLRYAAGTPPEQRAKIKHWTIHGLKWSLFLVAVRYFPALWLFIQPPRYRPYQGTSAGDTQTMTEQEARAILGISPLAKRSEIKRAYRERMRKVHPDAGGSVDEAIRLNLARDVLLKKAGD